MEGISISESFVDKILSSLRKKIIDPNTIERPKVIYNTDLTSYRRKEVFIGGPWIGELGVAMIRWVPFLRYIKKCTSNSYLITGGYVNEYCLYRDFADEYWVLSDSYKYNFLNQETSFNTAVFHEVNGNTAYREHASRKGFRNSKAMHERIAFQWFREIVLRNLRPSRLLIYLGSGRKYIKMKADSRQREQTMNILSKRKLDPNRETFLLFLPRFRKLQSDVRSWSINFYKKCITRLTNEVRIVVVILGSIFHEKEMIGFDGRSNRIINTISMHAGLDLQLAFWEIAQIGVGPPSGGLVLGYLTGTPLLHIYKPGRFPVRHGKRWDEACEHDYAIFGIKSNWVEAADDDTGVTNVVKRVSEELAKGRKK